ncbi:hypothetical protein GCM10011576_45110 [Micromonospora parathelypteridis]|uniref:Uncharacterized protein n=1 Tax=Micromonospora parathelypteridis TaxID=1839617 RepID=A0A840VWC4_9ACTN|nr:hypothetical protein [Micromonospora parathelypteridis]GGO24036.1 hypothetical protein GCM10011576_45110 [Micromonospora parathelypteridis]
MTVTRSGVILSVVTVLTGPLLAAAPAFAAPVAAFQPAGVVRSTSGALQHVVAAPAPQPGGPPGGAGQPAPSLDIFVEVSPSTVQPGYLVGIRASCRDNSVGATVVSDAFGAVGVQPQRGVLTAAPMVRERTRPGNYRVKLECRDGETASTMLQVVKKVPVQPSRGPATGFGGGAGGITGKLLLPGGAALTITGLILAVVALRRPRSVRGATRH